MIHISSIHSYVKENKEIDKESAKKVESYYIGKYFFKSMLPSILYSKVGSFTQNDEKFAMTLQFLINEEGVIIYEGDYGFNYRRSIIKKDLKLSYELADKILSCNGQQEIEAISKDSSSELYDQVSNALQ